MEYGLEEGAFSVKFLLFPKLYNVQMKLSK